MGRTEPRRRGLASKRRQKLAARSLPKPWRRKAREGAGERSRGEEQELGWAQTSGAVPGGEAGAGKPRRRTLFRSVSLARIPPRTRLPCSLAKKTGLWDSTPELLPHCRYTKEIEHFWVALSNLIASVHCTQEPK